MKNTSVTQSSSGLCAKEVCVGESLVELLNQTSEMSAVAIKVEEILFGDGNPSCGDSPEEATPYSVEARIAMAQYRVSRAIETLHRVLRRL